MLNNKIDVWKKAQTIDLKISKDIKPGFDIGFDKNVPEKTRAKLRDFIVWVEKNYNIPVTFWVDFEYKHYLKQNDGKRVGYIFEWCEFDNYPVFENMENIPTLRLPVRDEYYTIEEILTSFIEGISDYYAWLCNIVDESYVPDENEVENILQKYLRSSEHTKY